jgi:hypothetical protein
MRLRFPIIISRQKGIIRELRRIADALERAYPPPPRESDLKPIEDQDLERVSQADLAEEKVSELFRQAIEQGRDPDEFIEWEPEETNSR